MSMLTALYRKRGDGITCFGGKYIVRTLYCTLKRNCRFAWKRNLEEFH